MHTRMGTCTHTAGPPGGVLACLGPLPNVGEEGTKQGMGGSDGVGGTRAGRGQNGEQ